MLTDQNLFAAVDQSGLASLCPALWRTKKMRVRMSSERILMGLMMDRFFIGMTMMTMMKVSSIGKILFILISISFNKEEIDAYINCIKVI